MARCIICNLSNDIDAKNLTIRWSNRHNGYICNPCLSEIKQSVEDFYDNEHDTPDILLVREAVEAPSVLEKSDLGYDPVSFGLDGRSRNKAEQEPDLPPSDRDSSTES